MLQARPKFNDRKQLVQLADPRLEGRYPMRAFYQALAIASMCIQEDSTARPLIADVVTALSYLASQAYDPSAPTSVHRSGSRACEGRRQTDEREGSSLAKSEEPEVAGREDSPKEVAGILNRDVDRERAIAEAKLWGRKAAESSNGC